MLAHPERNPVAETDYRRIFMALPTPIALISMENGDPTIVTVSDRFAEQVGAPGRRLDGRRLSSVFRRRSGERLCRAVTDCAEASAPARTWIIRASGDRLLRMEMEARPLDDRVLLTIVEVAWAAGGDRRAAGPATDLSFVLAQAEQDERRRVGRELHDSTSQLLVAAQLGLGALQRRVKLPPETAAIAAEVRQSIAAAQREIRTFSFMLHPPSLRDGGFPNALRDFGAGFGLRTGLEVTVEIDDGPWSLPKATEMALFRVAQEGLMNVYRHAKARRASVRLVRDLGSVSLEIEDDGVGLPQIPGGDGGPVAPLGVGIAGMLARMTQLGGSLSLRSGRAGLRVRASAPLAMRPGGLA